MEPGQARPLRLQGPRRGVLGAGAYQSFIEENGLLEEISGITENVSAGSIGEKEAEETLALLREKIMAGYIPLNIREELDSRLKTAGILDKPVAVRSSASAEDSGGASFAGIHDSFLNVRGINNICSAVKECYASLWTPRAVAYRRKMNVSDEEMSQAVVIMKMVEARAADEKIVKLGLLLERVFESLGECEEHQDVEWAFDGQDFFCSGAACDSPACLYFRSYKEQDPGLVQR